MNAAYVVAPFDVPGCSYTDVWDISDTGKLVGTALGTAANSLSYGYVYDGRGLLRLDGPAGATGASALGISETGAVVGSWTDSNSPRQEVDYVWDPVTQTQVPQVVTVYAQRGFIWQSGSYATVNVPFVGATDTSLRAISPDGRYVSGTYALATSGLNSFVLDTQTGTFTALPSATGYRIAQGINGDAQMVGDRTSGQGYIMDLASGSRTDFSFSGVSRVAPRAINDKGQMAGWLADSTGTHAWIGNASGYQKIDAPNSWGATGGLIGEGLNNLGQVSGFWSDSSGNSHGFVATPAVDPVDQSVLGVYTFSTAVVADTPIFIDPKVAIGYDYKVGTSNPLFKTVSLPIGIGDNQFVITVGGQNFSVSGNQIFDFTSHGFAVGVGEFTVTGIEPQAMLDPANATAFVTRLTFMGDGMFTGTQTALTADYTPPVPEPGRLVLLLAGLAAVGLWWRHQARG